MRPQGPQTCPGCGQTDEVTQTPSTSHVDAWRCTRCGMAWAATEVNPHLRPDLGDVAEELGRLRWVLRQVTALAAVAPKLSNRELRSRLLTLADRAQR